MFKLYHSGQLNWHAALDAARALERIVYDAHFIPPEDLSRHKSHITMVCDQLGKITAALMITDTASKTS